MKLIYLLTGVLICCCSFSNCDKDDNFTCVDIKDGLTKLEPEQVQVANYINALLSPLLPNPTAEDPTGHRENLNTFASLMGQDCDLDVLVECYACIETFPVQSHVLVKLDSAGMIVNRTLDIRTPADTVMTLVNIHE